MDPDRLTDPAASGHVTPARDLAVAASFGPGAMLFGGYTGSGDAIALVDTWLWDGTTWAVQSGARLPPLGSAALGCE
jgi:hypothetical protein